MLKTILIALDDSKASETVIDALDDLQRDDQCKIILVHVIASSTREGEVEADRPGQSAESRYNQVEQQLLQYQANLKGSTVEITQGDPSEEIVRLANIYQADLIMIGTRGLRGLNRIIKDSVSSSVVENAPCSVFVVKV